MVSFTAGTYVAGGAPPLPPPPSLPPVSMYAVQEGIKLASKDPDAKAYLFTKMNDMDLVSCREQGSAEIR